jgi:predicted GNAT superfamily acetyltransferase
LRAHDLAGAEAVQRRLREEFLHWLERGYVVTGFARDEEGAEYLLEPYANTLTDPA